MNNALSWLRDMIELFGESEIKIPQEYPKQVTAVKEALSSDVSGLVSSLLDFAINCALVKFRVETGNNNLNEILNKWLNNINYDLKGKVPIGIKALAKEYFRERWKSGSFLVLRTKWYKKDGYKLPTKLWFVEGEDIRITNEDKKVINLGDEKYGIYIDESNIRKIPREKNEQVYVQKPFTSWGVSYPTPYLIQRGVYRNMKLLSLLEEKGENIISRALEYLLFMRKGTEKSALEGRSDFIYDHADLRKIKENFKKFMQDRKSSGGTSTYVSNFDTEIEHLIPEYDRGLKGALYEPIQQRILAGLGMVEVVEGIASTRREGIMNPKPFISEVKSGIEDFQHLIEDILRTVIEENTDLHPKYFKNAQIKLYASPIKEFISSDVREHIRSAYDRGNLSKRSQVEIGLDLDYDSEVRRRQEEYDKGEEELMYPHIVINKEGKISPTEQRRTENIPKKEEEDELEEEEKKLPDRKADPEKKNFQAVTIEEIKPYKGLKKDFAEAQSLIEFGKIVKRKDGWYVLSEKTGKNLGGPYRTYKEALKRLRQVEYFKSK
jgi:hypothetical protein